MMRKRLILATIVTCLAMPIRAWAGAHQELPEPDYEAIERAAQRTEPGQEYAKDLLPARLQECTAIAAPYASSPITSDMVTSKFILEACLRAMLRKLAELNFETGAFGPGGIDARMDEIAKPLFTIFYDFHNRGVYYDGDKKVAFCDGSACGSIAEQLLPRDDYVFFLMDFVRYVAGYGRDIDSVNKDWYDAWVKAGEFALPPPE
jgi:hypothetical protein